MKSLNKTQWSVLIFGMYMIAEGMLLILVPDMLARMLRVQAQEVWIRVVGWTLCVLGYYYIRLALHNIRHFFTLTVHIRLLQFVFFFVLVSLGLIEPIILALSAIEMASGVWTWTTLRKS